MKTCPNCSQVFEDDNDFCPNDGVTLVADAIGFGGFHSSGEMPTQFIQRPHLAPAASSTNSSSMLYLVIGVLAASFAGALIFIYATSGKRDESKKSDNAESAVAQSTPSASPTPSPIANLAVPPILAPPPVYPSLTPSGSWNGDWSGKSARFTATANLTEAGGRIEGRIVWTLVRSSNPQKMYKAGSTAVEYVRGTFNQTTRMVNLTGYRKDDPNNIVILDRYNMSLAADQRTMSGKSKNGVFRLSR